MVIYVPGTEETDPKKQNMSLQQLGGATTTLQTSAAANTAAIAVINAAGYVVGPASATDNALVRFDATTGKLVQNSEVALGDSDGKLTRTAGISVSGTNTNDSAAAGYVGEYIEAIVATGSAVGLTTATDANITSISLTAGDWDIDAYVTYKPAATTNFTFAWHSISTTSATNDSTTPGSYNIYRFPTGNVPAADFCTAGVGPLRKSLSATTTIYLVARVAFTVSTMAAYGIIRARRVR